MGCGCNKRNKSTTSRATTQTQSWRANFSNGQTSQVFTGPSAKRDAEAAVVRAGGGSVTRA